MPTKTMPEKNHTTNTTVRTIPAQRCVDQRAAPVEEFAKLHRPNPCKSVVNVTSTDRGGSSRPAVLLTDWV